MAGIRGKRGQEERVVSRTAKNPRKNPVGVYGTPSQDTDPAEVLLAEIRRTTGHIEWLSGQLQASDPESFVRALWMLKRQSGFIRDGEIDFDDFSQAGAMWLELYMTERRHLATIVRTALAAGIEERRVRLAERQAERVGEAFKGVLFDLSDLLGVAIDPEDDAVRAIIFKHLMTVSGAPPQEAPARRSALPLEIESSHYEE
jgi:hypothetical protein